MALRGSPSDSGPNACPFIALELDRDRRSERPDYRHRCYAEQVPAPRTIAHQERFCLSPNFSGCPIFQDWALRAAARPVPLPQGYEGRRAADPRAAAGAGAAAAGVAASPEPDLTPTPQPPNDTVWPDSMAEPRPADADVGGFSEAAGEEQLSAFDAPSPAMASASPALPLAPEPVHEGDWERAGGGVPHRDREPVQSVDQAEIEEGDGAPVPAFLVGRSSRPRRPSNGDAQVAREDVVPSWEIDDRYGAQGGGEPTGDGLFGRLLTIVAVVIILGLGVAAVILVPGLLAGSPQSTTRPSLVVPSRDPTPAVSGIAVVPTQAPPTVGPATVEPTSAATPAPTPKLYRIKSGDTLAKIARKNDVTVADILAANPQIPDADHIQVGQVIVIPLPAATPAP